MDETIDRLRAATVLAETPGALGPTSWAMVQRSDLVDGVLAVVEDSQGRLFAFVPRGGGPPAVLFVTSIVAVSKQASGFNTVVDLEFESDGQRETICLVAPRGRMKKIAAAVGHPI
jgi:hypothetical protein